MKRAGSLSNNELMAACRENGKGGGWEAEAVEHWRWQLTNGEGKERVLAWVKLHSIARGQPQCVDEGGRPLRVESMAADLGISVITAQHHCTSLVAEGRMRLKKAQMWYRADVPEKLPKEAGSSETKNSRVHDNFPAYVVDFYEKQSAEKRTKIDAALGALIDWRQQAFLEGLAGLRHEISRIEINTFSALGVPKIVLPKKAAQAPVWFQPMLLDEPDFVHDKGSAPVSRSVHTSAAAGVQGGPSLLPSRPDQTVVKSPPPPSIETSTSEVVMVASRIAGVNIRTAEKLLKACREKVPELPALVIVHLALNKLSASPNATSPVGLLLTKLAEEAAGPPLARAREAARREEERAVQERELAEATRVAAVREATALLEHPDATPSDVEWAQEVLAKAKGVGDAG